MKRHDRQAIGAVAAALGPRFALGLLARGIVVCPSMRPGRRRIGDGAVVARVLVILVFSRGSARSQGHERTYAIGGKQSAKIHGAPSRKMPLPLACTALAGAGACQCSHFASGEPLSATARSSRDGGLT